MFDLILTFLLDQYFEYAKYLQRIEIDGAHLSLCVILYLQGQRLGMLSIYLIVLLLQQFLTESPLQEPSPQQQHQQQRRQQ